MSFRDLWLLDERVTFLNHGSFGACPKAVLERQTELRSRLETEPVQFLMVELEQLLDEARRALGDFIGADADGIAFVPNATTAVNTVLRSLDLAPDDEVLITDHAYPGCVNAANHIAALTRARAVVAAVPFPFDSPDEIVRRVISSVSAKTRICIVDHVTSPTGLIFPVVELVRELKSMGVDAIVDGAHAPGMLQLEVREIGAAFYTGNCHKWLCAPKGAAFLYVAKEKRESIHPLVTSLGFGSGRTDRSSFHLEFDWVGTGDPTQYLCVPEAINYMGSLLPGGWPALMSRNREMALLGRRTLCDSLGIPVPCPDELIGSLASVPLPDGSAVSSDAIGDRDPIHIELLREYRIEVPVIPWPRPPKRLVRISAQIYNTPEEYKLLADALKKIL